MCSNKLKDKNTKRDIIYNDIHKIGLIDKVKKFQNKKIFVPAKNEVKTILGWGYTLEDNNIQYLVSGDFNKNDFIVTCRKYTLP